MANQMAAVIDSLGSLDESTHEFYTQAQDGKFVLNLVGRPRGFVPDIEHQEFRESNAALKAELKTSSDNLLKYDGINVEEYSELKSAKDELDRKEMVKKGDMEGLVATAVTKAVEPLSGQIETLQSTNKDLTIQLANKVVDEEIIKAGNAFGKMKSGTEEVLISKAKSAGFKNQNGELRQIVGDQVQFSTESPGQPMTVMEWIANEASKAFSWVWEPSTGGGGSGVEGDRALPTNGIKVIPRGDKDAFEKNIDDIASGKAQVA